MPSFSIPIQVRWSDLDPNFHLRHSVYYDWGAMCRLAFLEQFGLTIGLMQEQQFGPIIFREECIFRREILLGDHVSITLELLKSRKDYSRWTIQHQIMKGEETVAATLTVDGAWLDTSKRKLTLPPAQGVDVFANMPQCKDFQWTE
jgi:acyl-CoA thioester hydrolase